MVLNTVYGIIINWLLPPITLSAMITLIIWLIRHWKKD